MTQQLLPKFSAGKTFLMTTSTLLPTVISTPILALVIKSFYSAFATIICVESNKLISVATFSVFIPRKREGRSSSTFDK